MAASDLAKDRGVRTGTPIGEARPLCPEIRLIAQRPTSPLIIRANCVRSSSHAVFNCVGLIRKS